MAVASQLITVTTTRQQITIPDPITDAQAGCQIWIHNHEHSSSRSVFIGGADVTTSNGLHIPDTETIGPITLQHNESIWIVATDTSDVRILYSGA